MRTLLLCCALMSVRALAADPAPLPEHCPLPIATVEKLSGLKVVKHELRPWTFGQTQCVFIMESGSVQFQRMLPEAKSVKTEAELAAKLADEEKRRVLKDFSVPAYSFTGGLTLVLPKGGIWQVIVMQGEKRGLDKLKLGQALVEAKAKER